MLTVVSWLWGDKYGESDVAKLRRGLKTHLQQEHRFVLISDRGPSYADHLAIPLHDYPLLRTKGCFARLRLFDPGFQKWFKSTDRIVCIDLDVVVTGPLDPLFNRAENFVILHGANAVNPCPVNGSLWMLRPGYRPDVWSDFSLEAAQKVPFFEFPDDQGWMHHKIPNAAAWHVGSRSGVYAFMKPGWPIVTRTEIDKPGQQKLDGGLPGDARLVVFPGWRSPEKFKHLSWVKESWV